MRNKKNISKIFSVIILSVVMTTACEKPVKEVLEEEEVIPVSISETAVYTTAHQTDLNLSKTGTVNFEKFQQPLETEASILVNKDRLHQTFVGIGAALTDASAPDRVVTIGRPRRMASERIFISSTRATGPLGVLTSS